MSKPKVRVMCPAIGRLKMVFETEKKAKNFIRFNSEDFEKEVVPVRAYYCSACGGWHVTHKENWVDDGEDPVDKLIGRYKRATTKPQPPPPQERKPKPKEKQLTEQEEKTVLYKQAYDMVCKMRYKYHHDHQLLEIQEVRDAMTATRKVEEYPNKEYLRKKTEQLGIALEGLWYNMTSFYLNEIGRAVMKENDQELLGVMKADLKDWMGLQPSEVIIRSTIYSTLDDGVQNLIKRIDDKIKDGCHN